LDITLSKNKHKIRLTSERWFHITMGHPEMVSFYYEILETIRDPDEIYKGNNLELIAIKYFNSINKFIVVIYKEIEPDNGFVITSFLTNKKNHLNKKKIIWKKVN
jgi:hypothetical protein